MTDIAIDKRFNSNSWSEDITGTGSLVYGANPENAQAAGDLVTCDGDNVSRAMVMFRTNLAPSETIEFDVMCRNDVSTPDWGNIYIESGGARVAELNMTNDDWERSETLRWTAPFNERFAMVDVRIFIGSSSTRNNKSYFTQPTLKKYGGFTGTRQVVMDGVIEITAGTYSLNSGYVSHNVDETTFTIEGSGELSVRPHGENNIAQGAIPQLTLIRAAGAGAPKYFWEARTIASTNRLQIACYDDAGVIQNISTLPDTHRIAFTLWM